MASNRFLLFLLHDSVGKNTVCARAFLKTRNDKERVGGHLVAMMI